MDVALLVGEMNELELIKNKYREEAKLQGEKTSQAYIRYLKLIDEEIEAIEKALGESK